MNKYIHEILSNDSYRFAIKAILESNILSLEELVDIVIEGACESDISKLLEYIDKNTLSSKEYNKLVNALMHINTSLANRYLAKLLNDDSSNKEEIIEFLIQNGDYYSLSILNLDLENIFKENKLKLNYLEVVKNIWHRIFLNQNDYYEICQFLINQNIYSQKIFRTILENSNRSFIEYFKKYLEHIQELPDINSLTNTLNDIFFQNEISKYSNDELFNYLISLAQKGDISTLSKNKETFKTIFTKEESQELHK